MDSTKISSDSNQKCLVCNQNFNSRAKHPIELINNCSEKVQPVLSNELKVVLLLRKVLRIPQSALLNLLEQFGNPSDWNVHLCGPCSSIFREAEFIHRRVLKFNADFEQLAKELRCVMQESTKGTGVSEPYENYSKTEMAKGQENEKSQIKRTLRRRKGPGRPPKSKPTIEIEPTSFTAVESLRQSFLHNDQDQSGKRYAPQESSYNMHCRTVSIVLEKIPIQPDTFVDSPFINSVSEGNEINESPRDNAEAEDANDDFHFLRPHTPTIIKQEKNISHTIMNDNDECIFEDDFNVEVDNSDPDWTVTDTVNDNDIDEAAEEAKCDDLDEDGDWTESRSSRQRGTTKRKNLNKRNIVRARKTTFQRQIMSESLAKVPSGTAIEEFVEDGGSFGCPKCNKTFRRKLICHAHILRAHYGDPLPFHCHICKAKRCSTEKLFRIHMNRFHKSARNPQDPDYDPDQHSAEIFEKEIVERIDNKDKSGESMEKVPTLPENILEKFKDDKETSYDCAQCGRSCTSKMLRDAHVKRVHEGISNPFPCEQCHRSYARRCALLQHVAKVHFGSSHVCPHCATRFADEILKDAHIRRVHLGDSKPFRCTFDSCSRKFYRRFQLSLHVSTQHGTRLPDVPKRKRKTTMFRNRNLAQELEKQRGTSYECTFCTLNDGTYLNFDSRNEMRIHMENQHKGEKRWQCPFFGCNKKFIAKVSLERHVASNFHEAEKKFQGQETVEPDSSETERELCNFCGKQFKTKLYLQDHQRQKHYKELKLQPFKCTYCGKILNTERSLQNHTKVFHTKDTKFKCKECGYGCMFAKSLQKHIEVSHLKIEAAICPICSRTFRSSIALTTHIRIHTGEKPYKCPVCEKRFSDNPTYNRHVEAHAGRIHTCPIETCKRQYNTRHAFRTHLKQHQRKGVMVEIPEVRYDYDTEDIGQGISDADNSSQDGVQNSSNFASSSVPVLHSENFTLAANQKENSLYPSTSEVINDTTVIEDAVNELEPPVLFPQI